MIAAMRTNSCSPWLLLLALLVVGCTMASAQGTPCPNPPFPQPWGHTLEQHYPPSIAPDQKGDINTSLVIRKRDLCVPVWAPIDPSNPKSPNTWQWQQFSLRTYGFPRDSSKPMQPDNPNDPNLQWGFPGPTLQARKATVQDPTRPPGPANPVQTPGTRIKLALYNRLPNNTFPYDQCEATYVCTQKQNGQWQACNFANNQWTCPSPPDTCMPLPQPDHACFHGTDVTNMHYHGTHVSPQPPQDFVLLNLFSKDQTDPKPPPASQTTAIGQYQFNIDPLPWNQAPGTFWYHPHKHGSTSVQVLNGMAGALLIAGPFDDWLHGLYDGKLVDRVLVVQQLGDKLNFFTRDVPNYPPQALVNGYATPQITMRPGEMQRWRFIGATMQASASLEIGFDGRMKEVRQIAQDGVQFAWQNYERQPYRDNEGTYKNFQLSPGTRADFLIQAPSVPGTYAITQTIVAPALAENVRTRSRAEVSAVDRTPPTAVPTTTPPVDKSGNPLLLTIEVSTEPIVPPMQFPVTQKTEPTCLNTPKPPHCWPDMPFYLQDLPNPGQLAHTVAFSMVGNNTKQPSFYINNVQYNASCANATMVMGATEDWLIKNEPGQNNTKLLPHPFHIHVNPFQVLRNADRGFEPPYVWQDTIALPVPSARDRQAGPIWNNDDAQARCQRTCAANNATWNGQWTTTIPGVMSVCGCIPQEASVLIRHRFDDYSGAYVLHCHFLGHEDRGMMWNVQTVCAQNNLFGTPVGAQPDNCATPSSFKPNPLPQCTGAAH